MSYLLSIAYWEHELNITNGTSNNNGNEICDPPLVYTPDSYVFGKSSSGFGTSHCTINCNESRYYFVGIFYSLRKIATFSFQKKKKKLKLFFFECFFFKR